jgi:hypothetical protein
VLMNWIVRKAVIHIHWTLVALEDMEVMLEDQVAGMILTLMREVLRLHRVT